MTERVLSLALPYSEPRLSRANRQLQNDTDGKDGASQGKGKQRKTYEGQSPAAVSAQQKRQETIHGDFNTASKVMADHTNTAQRAAEASTAACSGARKQDANDHGDKTVDFSSVIAHVTAHAAESCKQSATHRVQPLPHPLSI